ncbi:electron transfer flavoprotein subunit beta [Litorimonas cladophorae]|uniref:Electron transfer flavoprotein subunit beta n=1 Tax=Litorimonas cladophorae TaxID=1220491 RepID=A0A918NJY3_9PROT|nr:electron transfer flavoprotein subunit beta/FixA family protein [Litorimonas cladophorae]GGX73248.1 electron transfer flavoprotein subunit beta [Litorimonas cladophorae]
MKVLVPVKRVLDYNVKARVKPDQSGVDLSNVKMSMNPFDEIAVEEAVRLQEAGTATETIVVSIGPAKAQETIRTGLAMGMDRGVHVQTDEDLEPLAIAKILKAVAEAEGADLIVMGKQAIDNDYGATGGMLAALLGWPIGSAANSIALDGGALSVVKEVDGGLQTVKLQMPALVTADLRLNEPRYASLPNIMKAKRKPIDAKTPADFGVDTTPRLKTLKVTEPAAREAGIKVEDAAALVDKLKNEAGVI